MHNWSFKQFLNSDNPAWVEDYYSGLSSALKKYNVDSTILPTVNRFGSNDTKYIIVELDGLQLGGIRIEIKSLTNQLPIEKSNIKVSDAINEKIKYLTHDGMFTIAEICGLWANSDAKKQFNGVSGLGKILARKALELSIDSKVDLILSVLPQHTLPYFLDLNFNLDPNLQNIFYPDDRYLSSIVWYDLRHENLTSHTTQLTSSDHI